MIFMQVFGAELVELIPVVFTIGNFRKKEMSKKHILSTLIRYET